MRYRPKGWENPYKKWGVPEDAYEAGADAILDYLTSQEHQDWLADTDGRSCAGRWIFLPEEG